MYIHVPFCLWGPVYTCALLLAWLLNWSKNQLAKLCSSIEILLSQNNFKAALVLVVFVSNVIKKGLKIKLLFWICHPWSHDQFLCIFTHCCLVAYWMHGWRVNHAHLTQIMTKTGRATSLQFCDLRNLR